MNFPKLTIPSADTQVNDPFAWAEIQRITSLPRVTPTFDPACVDYDAIATEELNRMYVKVEHFNKGFRLTPGQAEGISAYEIYGSVFGKLPVGDGKTALSLMIASAAFRKGFERMLLLVPPEVFGQLTQTDIAWARSRVEINFPIHVLGGKSLEYRRSLCRSKYKGLYIMPYSLLSTKDTSENLQGIAPQLIIADEAHRLANHSAARTRRFISLLKHLSDKGNPAELVILSGTITNKSIKDYYHLIKWCLKERCPLPLSDSMANDWALLVDAQATSADGAGLSPLGAAPIVPIVKWAQGHYPDEPGGWPANVFGFRKAFKYRLSTAPGVVSSSGSGVDTSLIIQNMDIPDPEGKGSTPHKDWPELKRLIDQVEEAWLTPNGDEIDYAIHKWKWLNELSLGFYNQLTWPGVDEYAKRKKITEAQATETLEHAKAHHQAGQQYVADKNHGLRQFLKNSHRPGCDTPFLVGQSMVRNGDKDVGKEMYKLWKEWKDLDFEGRPDRDSKAVKVCDWKIQALARNAGEFRRDNPGSGTIYWYHHQEVGRWLVEAMSAKSVSGILHCPAGEHANKTILDHANKDRIVVASWDAHGTGKNLQHFEHMCVVQWPRSARTAEQLLGRLHRRGQKADELPVTTCNSLLFDHMNMAACLNDALYIHQSTGDKQKLIYANYDPLPKIFPPAVLYQRGLEVDKLTAEQEAMLTEKFGGYTKGLT